MQQNVTEAISVRDMAVSREYLIHLLTEAAEIEHNLLCSYLYAAFSLKTAADGLAPDEAERVGEWRKSVLSVAIEEMGHLVLVNNLIVAIGGTAHFDRPNLPVPPGYHPASFVIRLTPFTKETLDHFIFLERPEDLRMRDGAGFNPESHAPRTATRGQLTPSTPDYETIGQFYAEIREATLAHCERYGDAAFIEDCGQAQIGPDAVDLEGVRIIRGLEDALAALHTIVEQGEGAGTANDASHFTRFLAIQKEWAALERGNPRFAPAHPAAHDPVMRRPAQGVERVWITEPKAAESLDLANALYGLCLSFLTHAYAPSAAGAERSAHIQAALALMGAMGTVGTALTRLPAGGDGGENAGMTFAVPRNVRIRARNGSTGLLRERLAELERGAEPVLPGKLGSAFRRAREALDRAEERQ